MNEKLIDNNFEWREEVAKEIEEERSRIWDYVEELLKGEGVEQYIIDNVSNIVFEKDKQ